MGPAQGTRVATRMLPFIPVSPLLLSLGGDREAHITRKLMFLVTEGRTDGMRGGEGTGWRPRCGGLGAVPSGNTLPRRCTFWPMRARHTKQRIGAGACALCYDSTPTGQGRTVRDSVGASLWRSGCQRLDGMVLTLPLGQQPNCKTICLPSHPPPRRPWEVGEGAQPDTPRSFRKRSRVCQQWQQ